jgi:hypothetical protein
VDYDGEVYLVMTLDDPDRGLHLTLTQ